MTKHIFRVPVDREHFQDTIVRGKSYTQLLPYLTDTEKEHVRALAATSGILRYWGSLPGKSNTKVFKLVEEDDELLCYRSGRYIAVATIAYTTINPALARFSWGQTTHKETWELLYFLRDVTLISVEVNVLNSAWGLQNGPVMGFSKLSEETAQPFISEYESVAKFLTQLAGSSQDEKAA